MNNFKIRQPSYIKKCHKILNKNGYESYIVGGCVRDYLLDKEPKDWDMTTNATPEQIISCFSPKYKIIETGLKHGTVTIIINNYNVEITTYRTESEYSDNRHPNEVTFVKNLKEDLSRRDFTINAMAYNDKDGLVDYFGGYEDLLTKTIRCVGTPQLRFSEDALRILRAIRFYCTLGKEWKIDSQTQKSIHINYHGLKNVSRERIHDEFIKIFIHKEKFVNYFYYNLDVLYKIFPEFSTTNKDFLRHCLDSYKYCPSTKTSVLLATLFHAIFGCPQKDHVNINVETLLLTCENSLKNLKFDNKTIKETLNILKYVNTDIKEDYSGRQNIIKLFNQMGPSTLYDLIDVRIGCNLAKWQGEENVNLRELKHFRNVCKCIERQNPTYKISQLKINGDDIKKIIPNITGVQIGELLNKCLDMVIKELIPNQRKDLLKFINANKYIYRGEN